MHERYKVGDFVFLKDFKNVEDGKNKIPTFFKFPKEKMIILEINEF